jgi:hypothetical protein
MTLWVDTFPMSFRSTLRGLTTEDGDVLMGKPLSGAQSGSKQRIRLRLESLKSMSHGRFGESNFPTISNHGQLPNFRMGGEWLTMRNVF